MWYYRTRGRFDIIGEVGKAKGVLGLELDHVFGQAGSNDSTIVNAGAAATTAVQTGFGTDGSFDLNTDSRGIIEVKWLYVEFPMPLIPVPTTARLGAQPFGALANYKLAVYATGDFPGVSITSQITPNFKFVGTYVQVEENLAGTETRTSTGTPCPAPAGVLSTQIRGDDFAYIIAPEITPFKGLDIKPMFSMFYAQGTTNGSARAGRGGLNTTHRVLRRPATCAAASTSTATRWDWIRGSGWGRSPSIRPSCTSSVTRRSSRRPPSRTSGAVPGRKVLPDMNAWLVDVRAGFQLGTAAPRRPWPHTARVTAPATTRSGPSATSSR